MNGIEQRVRSLLVCPSCRGELVDVPGSSVCVSERRAYPVQDRVPFLVVECSTKASAKQLTAAERALEPGA